MLGCYQALGCSDAIRYWDARMLSDVGMLGCYQVLGCSDAIGCWDAYMPILPTQASARRKGQMIFNRYQNVANRFLIPL